jgi:hypothetical protein
VRPTPDATGWVVDAPLCAPWRYQDAFTADGVRVPLEPGATPSEVVIAGSPGPVYLLGVESLGENASARQTERPQVCLAALPAPPVTPATTAPPVTRADAGPTAAPRPSGAVRGAPARTARLADSGATPLWGWAAGLVVAGGALVLTARRAAR